MNRLAGFFNSTLAGVQLAAVLAVLPVSAQDLTHPKAMNLPQPAFQRPDPDALRLTLDNGLVAYVAEDRRVPLVSVTAYIGVGTGHGAAGEAEALAAALRRGPDTMADGAFGNALDAMYAQYTVTMDHEETTIHLDVPAANASTALALVADVVSAPDFDEPTASETAEQAGKAVAGGIDYSYSLQGAVELFEDRLYEGHAFGRDAGDEEGNPGSAKSLHERVVRAQNVTLAVAGDVPADALRSEIRRLFGVIAPGSVERAAAVAPIPARPSRALILSDVDRDQGWVVIGHELPVIPPEDEAALHVMDYILGAYHLDSRLYRSSRELRGLTNDNSSFLQPGIDGPGSYTFRTYGRPEAVRLLVDVTFRQLDMIRETTATEDELFVAKGALIDGLYAERYATALDAVNSYAKEWLRKGGHESSASYPERIAAVTVEEVRAAAQQYIHPERMIIAVMGPLDRIRRAPAIEGEPQLDTHSTR